MRQGDLRYIRIIKNKQEYNKVDTINLVKVLKIVKYYNLNVEYDNL